MIEEKTFRQDLYYRLHVVPLRIPPLRERKQDILVLTDYFLEKFNRKYSQRINIDENAKLFIQLQEWRGNVRELENFIEHLVVTAHKPLLSIEDLPIAMDNRIQNDFSFKEIPLKKPLKKQRSMSFYTHYRNIKRLEKWQKPLG